MSCNRIRDLESGFLDGLLSPQERRLVEEHQEICAACRARLALFASFRSSLRDNPAPAPHALETLVMRRVHRNLQRRPLWTELREGFRCWREDWNSSLLFSRMAAVPLTLLCFVSILWQFSAVPGTLGYPVYSLDADGTASEDGSHELQLSYAPMVRFAQQSAPLVPDDSFVVLTRVDKNGVTTLEQVIDAPQNRLLLRLFTNKMETIRRRPLRRNGSRSDSYLIVPYQKISVVG